MSINRGEEIGPGTGSEAYEMVMDAIITQRLAPSQKVSEYILADMFDMTRTTARSIIERLITQQFLISVSPRITRVAPLALIDIKQNFTIRKMLEPQIFSMAAANADLKAIGRLFKDVVHEGAIDDEATALRLLKANKQSNLYLVECAKYPLLIQWVSQLEDTAMRIYWLHLKLMRTFPFSLEHQRKLVDLLRQCDAEGVHKHSLMILNACEERVMQAIFMHEQLNAQDLHLPS